MESVNAFFSIAGGLAIRLGLPVGITALLIWVMRKLDARWQAEANEQAAPQPAISRVRCWEKKSCPTEKLETCKAYQRQEIPCWQVFRHQNGELQQACIGCRVLQEAPIPVYR